MNRKDLIIAVLATFCLTASVFMVFPTRSADDPNWDPWADIKHALDTFPQGATLDGND